MNLCEKRDSDKVWQPLHFFNYLSSSGKFSVVQKLITQTKWIFCTKIITNKLGTLPMHSYGSGAMNNNKKLKKQKQVPYCYNQKGRDLVTVTVPVFRIRIHMFLGLPDPDPLVKIWIRIRIQLRILLSSCKNIL